MDLIAGKHPFPADSEAELMLKVLMESPEVPSQVPSRFKTIIEGCLIKDHSQRWNTKQVLAALNSRPITHYVLETPTNKPITHYTEVLPGGIELEMLSIPAGSFLMGSPDGEGDRDEHPQHRVNVPSFYLGKYPVTQAQYQAIMGTNPAHFKGDRNPVEQVSWYDAIEFCIKLSQLTGKQYRLPSEAEWEYACRAGTQTKYYFGNDEKQLGEYAWYGSNSNGQTHPVGQKKPNQWGLYDMHSNVREWCLVDWHGDYNNAPTDGRAWFDDKDFQQAINKINENSVSMLYYDLNVIKTNENNSQLLRGGSWIEPFLYRCAYRSHFTRDKLIDDFGFRVLCRVGRT